MFSRVTLARDPNSRSVKKRAGSLDSLTCLGDRQHPGRAPNLHLDDNGDLQVTSSRALERTHFAKLFSQFKEKETRMI